MPRNQSTPTPLLDHCDGADADDRSALVAAFMRIWRQQPKRNVTDLHVREFILAIFAVAKGPSGVQWSHEEIADRLCCTHSTARTVVTRATTEFGLVAVAEERYLRGGQGANRYSIHWQAVRTINAGLVHRRDIGKPATAVPTGGRPAVVSQHPGAVRQQPGVVRQHPFNRNSTSITTSTSTSTHSLTCADEHRAIASGGTPPDDPDPWRVVVSELDSRSMGAIPEAITAAQSRELTAQDVLDLVERWERLRAHQPGVTVGWLYRWIVGRSKPPEDPGASAPQAKRTSLTSETTRREMVRSRIVREGRRCGKSEQEISQAIADALARRESHVNGHKHYQSLQGDSG